ncbi:MAG: hypothetical protein IIB28_10870 [Chloroflexi bacterium]|nr:hypothetical protein [Chloroflexota bacterium]
MPRKSIECRAKIVSNLADHHAPFIGKRGRATFDAKFVVSGLFVELA